MGKMLLLGLLLIVTTALAQDEQTIIFGDEEIHAKPNEKVLLECGINGTFRYCVWEHGGQIFQTQDVHDDDVDTPGMSKPESIEDNQCGIVLDSASTEDHGEWTCKVFIKGGSLLGSKNVTIPVKPTQAKITPAELIATADEETKIECSVMAARPAVQLKWLLADEDITESSEVEDTPVTADGTFMTVSTLKRTFTPVENEQELKCVVEHPTLEEPETTMVPVQVVYAPVEKAPNTFYEVNEGDDFEIRVKFLANPKPTKVLWHYSERFDDIINIVEIPVDDEMMMTSLETLVNGHFIAVLKISNLTEEDFKRKYNLFVENEIGRANYQVMLSMDKVPTSSEVPEDAAAELSNDQTIVIVAVIAVIVVLIIVSLIVVFVLRRSQKCCFSPKEAKAEEEKEEANPDAEKGVTTNGNLDENSKLIVETEVPEKEDKNGNEEIGNGKTEVVENGVTEVDENSKEVSDKNEKNGSVV